MAEKLDPKEMVSFKELLISEMIQSEALVNLLERKGILTKQELLDEIMVVRSKLPRQKEGAYIVCNVECVITTRLTTNCNDLVLMRC